MYYVYNGFYIFDFIAHCWATFSALCALLSSHIMTNKDDDDDLLQHQGQGQGQGQGLDFQDQGQGQGHENCPLGLVKDKAKANN